MGNAGIRGALAALLGVCVLTAFCAPVQAQDGLPQYFTIGPQGELTCGGTTEDACAYSEEIPTPAGTLYLVQGSFSRPRTAADKRAAGADFINYYFALLCTRAGDTLTPVFNFLEGHERASDIHLHDLDVDGTPEVIVTAIYDAKGSYASVYRVSGPAPERIFFRRANSAHTDFEVDHGRASLLMEQRDPQSGHDVHEEVFTWNGSEFVLEP